jgi:hypothetical protein
MMALTPVSRFLFSINTDIVNQQIYNESEPIEKPVADDSDMDHNSGSDGGVQAAQFQSPIQRSLYTFFELHNTPSAKAYSAFSSSLALAGVVLLVVASLP